MYFVKNWYFATPCGVHWICSIREQYPYHQSMLRDNAYTCCLLIGRCILVLQVRMQFSNLLTWIVTDS